MSRKEKPALPQVGDVFGFPTLAHFEANPPVTGRFGALKILLVQPSRGADRVTVAVLGGCWSSMPALADVASARILRPTLFAHSGITPDVFAANWDIQSIAPLVLLGNISLDAEQSAFAEKYREPAAGYIFGFLAGALAIVEGQWRWDNDREALIAEEKERKRREEEKRRLAEERYQKRLKGLTWATLESERPFKAWSPSPPFPPREFTEKLTIWTYDLYRQLQALGPKPKKAEVRKVMKDFVAGVNVLDEEMNHPIETEERERLCEVIEEALHVARHRSLMDEVDEWRDW